MIDWPEYLIDAIARRKSVLFLGSGYQQTLAMMKGNIH